MNLLWQVITHVGAWLWYLASWRGISVRLRLRSCCRDPTTSPRPPYSSLRKGHGGNAPGGLATHSGSRRVNWGSNNREISNYIPVVTFFGWSVVCGRAHNLLRGLSSAGSIILTVSRANAFCLTSTRRSTPTLRLNLIEVNWLLLWPNSYVYAIYANDCAFSIYWRQQSRSPVLQNDNFRTTAVTGVSGRRWWRGGRAVVQTADRSSFMFYLVGILEDEFAGLRFSPLSSTNYYMLYGDDENRSSSLYTSPLRTLSWKPTWGKTAHPCRETLPSPDPIDENPHVVYYYTGIV